jgi:hypothetical protein
MELVRPWGRTRSRWRRFLPLLVAAAACAAVGVVCWDGTGTANLTVSQAVAIALDANLPPSQRRLAIIALRRSAAQAVTALRQLSDDEGPAGDQARHSIDCLRKELENR